MFEPFFGWIMIADKVTGTFFIIGFEFKIEETEIKILNMGLKCVEIGQTEIVRCWSGWTW